MKSYFSFFLLVPMFFYCAPKKLKNLEGETIGLLEQICQVEQSRHKKPGLGELVFINNRFIDQYGQSERNPEHLWQAILYSHGICREAYLQVMGRYHARYIETHRHQFQEKLLSADWLHIIYGLKTVEPEQINMKILLQLVSNQHSPEVRKQATRLFNDFMGSDYCKIIQPVLEQETNPEVLEEWMLTLNLNKCPNLLAWSHSLFEVDYPHLHQSILATWSQFDFPERNSYISAYLEHPDLEVQSMAESILAQLENKKR